MFLAKGIRSKHSPFSKKSIWFVALFFTFFTAKAYCLKGDIIKLPGKRPPITGEKTGVEISKAKVENITSQNYPGLIESFEFNAPLRDVIKTMSKFLNMNIILGPSIGAERIEIISHSPITVAEAYKAFLSALAIQNLTIIKSGSFLKVIKKEFALRSNLRVYKGKKSINADQFLTRIIKLKHIDASSLQDKMKPFIDDKAVSSLIFYPPSNTVIISGYGSNVEKVRTIITGIDTPSEDFTLRVFRLRIAQANTIAEIIKDIIKNLTPTGSRRRYYGSMKNKSQGISQLLNIQSVSHDERTNSIIAMGHPTALEKLGALIKTLDSDENTKMSAQIHVYKVKYGKAGELSNTLNQIFRESSSSKDKSTTKLKSGSSKKGSSAKPNTVLAQAFKDVKIIPEENTNSLFIVSNTANYEVVKTILNKVDISKNQVFVKAIIMALSTDRSNEWQMANYFFPKDDQGKGIARIGYGLSNLADVFSFSEGATLFFPLSLFFKGNLFGTATDSRTDISSLFRMNNSANAGVSSPQEIKVPSLSSFVKFLQRTVGANILSTPQIMALDHTPAEVSITDKIPSYGSRPATTSNVFGQVSPNIEYQDAETLLKITPHIAPDVDSIQLDIEQKIDSVVGSANIPADLKNTNIAIKKRTIKTSITLKDRETAVLGGMVKEESTKTNSKIPILGDLPLIGWLFKNSSTDIKKSNLIVFITPHIIHSAEEHQTILSSKLKERMKFIRQFTGNADPYQEITEKMLKKSEDSIQERDDPLPEFEQDENSIYEDPGANAEEVPTTEETKQSENYYYYDDDEYYSEDEYSEETKQDNYGNTPKDNFSPETENNITSSRQNIEQNTEEPAESEEETPDSIEIKGDWGPMKTEPVTEGVEELE